jgi:hypothetical protein
MAELFARDRGRLRKRLHRRGLAFSARPFATLLARHRAAAVPTPLVYSTV